MNTGILEDVVARCQAQREDVGDDEQTACIVCGGDAVACRDFCSVCGPEFAWWHL